MGQAKNILQQIQSGKISPVYLLHGEETYLIEETLEKMIDLLAPNNVRDFNLDIFSEPEVTATEILSMADTYPVMADRRVVVAKDPAFLGSGKKADPSVYLRESMEQYRAGNLSKSATLMARSLEIEPEELAEGGTAFRRAVEAFKKGNENGLSSEEIEFLENAAVNLASEIDIYTSSSSGGDVEQLIEYLRDGTPPTTVLIFTVSSTLKANSKLVKTFSKAGTAANFGQLRQSRYVNRDPMYQMVMDRLKGYKKTISPDAFVELQKKTGKKISGRMYSNAGQIFDEIDKLVTFIGSRQRIEKRDVEELVTRTGFDEIFGLTDAIGQKSLPMALASLKSILEKGEKPLPIHGMLTRQIRFLLQAKLMLESGELKPEMARMSYDVFQKRAYKQIPSELIERLPESPKFNLLKQHPYSLHLTLQQAKNFTIPELTKAMKRLLEADIQLKSGSLTPELVLEMLAMDLISN